MTRLLPIVVAVVLHLYPGLYLFARWQHLVVRNDRDGLQTGDLGIGTPPVAKWFAPFCWLEERYWSVAHRHGPGE
ncbi:MAG: hypothetical protein QM723_23205 [Myxococcaceae bacterium]